jgi:hypothetical protein
MTYIDIPHLPIPTGAFAGDWNPFTGHPDDLLRFLTWSRHDAAGVVVAVEGAQYADGRVDRYIRLCASSEDLELTPAAARKFAAALLDAADALDSL